MPIRELLFTAMLIRYKLLHITDGFGRFLFDLEIQYIMEMMESGTQTCLEFFWNE